MGKLKIGYLGGQTPDWLDVNACIRAIDGIHLGRTLVAISPEGTGATGGLRIMIATFWDTLPGGKALGEVITQRVWTGHSNDQLPAFILGGLYQHDFAVGSAYQQAEIQI